MNIDYKQSFYKTEEMLNNSYKRISEYIHINRILKYELEFLLNHYVFDDDITKKIRNTINTTNEILNNDK